MTDLPDLTHVRPVAANFACLMLSGATHGFLELVLPATFEESCAEQRILRDLEGEEKCARCGGIVQGGGFRCVECLETHRASTEAVRAKRRAEGVCIFCGGEMPCVRCAVRSSTSEKRLRAQRRANGLCERCGEVAVKGGYCEKHRGPKLVAARAREARRRVARLAAGLCAGCGRETPVEGGTYGAVCRERRLFHKRAIRHA
jgi:hypothetical protein